MVPVWSGLWKIRRDRLAQPGIAFLPAAQHGPGKSVVAVENPTQHGKFELGGFGAAAVAEARHLHPSKASVQAVPRGGARLGPVLQGVAHDFQAELLRHHLEDDAEGRAHVGLGVLSAHRPNPPLVQVREKSDCRIDGAVKGFGEAAREGGERGPKWLSKR